jgi:hypothetical protein
MSHIPHQFSYRGGFVEKSFIPVAFMALTLVRFMLHPSWESVVLFSVSSVLFLSVFNREIEAEVKKLDSKEDLEKKIMAIRGVVHEQALRLEVISDRAKQAKDHSEEIRQLKAQIENVTLARGLGR